MVKKYGELYLQARKALRPMDGDDASSEARELLAWLSGKTPEKILTDWELYATEALEQAMDACIARMLQGEPLAYVVGSASFCGLTLRVTPDVLIPRDDTMAVTELALEALRTIPAPQRVLDLCTGSGCIGLALASRYPQARATLADISPEALKIARENAASLHLSTRATVFQADARRPAAPFLGKFDLLVSNPPYVTQAEMERLPVSVRNYEPSLALCGGEDGLDFYRAILKNYLSVLKPGGAVCLEFGFGQQAAVGTLLEQAGLCEIVFRKDYHGVIRAVRARVPEE